MSPKPLFAGLIVDENDQPVPIKYVGEEPCYVVNDAGFLRHIPSIKVDQQVLKSFQEMIAGNEDQLSEQTASMLGQDDIFTRAMLTNQFKNIEDQFAQLFEMGIPEEGRAYLGMLGFKIRINVHGDVIELIQPGAIAPEDDL